MNTHRVKFQSPEDQKHHTMILQYFINRLSLCRKCVL